MDAALVLLVIAGAAIGGAREVTRRFELLLRDPDARQRAGATARAVAARTAAEASRQAVANPAAATR